MAKPDGWNHDNGSAYTTHRCRCKRCVAWKSAYQKAYYRRNADKLRAYHGAYQKRQRQAKKAAREATP